MTEAAQVPTPNSTVVDLDILFVKKYTNLKDTAQGNLLVMSDLGCPWATQVRVTLPPSVTERSLLVTCKLQYDYDKNKGHWYLRHIHRAFLWKEELIEHFWGFFSIFKERKGEREPSCLSLVGLEPQRSRPEEYRHFVHIKISSYSQSDIS